MDGRRLTGFLLWEGEWFMGGEEGRSEDTRKDAPGSPDGQEQPPATVPAEEPRSGASVLPARDKQEAAPPIPAAWAAFRPEEMGPVQQLGIVVLGLIAAGVAIAASVAVTIFVVWIITLL